MSTPQVGTEQHDDEEFQVQRSRVTEGYGAVERVLSLTPMRRAPPRTQPKAFRGEGALDELPVVCPRGPGEILQVRIPSLRLHEALPHAQPAWAGSPGSRWRCVLVVPRSNSCQLKPSHTPTIITTTNNEHNST